MNRNPKNVDIVQKIKRDAEIYLNTSDAAFEHITPGTKSFKKSFIELAEQLED